MKNPPLAQPQRIDFLNLRSSKFAFFKVKKKEYNNASLIHQMWYFGLVNLPDNLLTLSNAEKCFLCNHFYSRRVSVGRVLNPSEPRNGGTEEPARWAILWLCRWGRQTPSTQLVFSPSSYPKKSYFAALLIPVLTSDSFRIPLFTAPVCRRPPPNICFF